MKRSGPPRRKTPLPRPTKPIKRQAIVREQTTDDAWRAAAAVVRRRSRGWCEAKVGGVCTRYAQGGPHHVRLRSRGGPDTPDNLLDVCRECHAWIHANPADATARGLMRSAWGAT